MEQNEASRQKILDYFGAGLEQWQDYKWQLKHIVRDLDTLEKIIDLREEERESLQLAEKNGIFFQITPYYPQSLSQQPGEPQG